MKLIPLNPILNTDGNNQSSSLLRTRLNPEASRGSSDIHRSSSTVTSSINSSGANNIFNAFYKRVKYSWFGRKIEDFTRAFSFEGLGTYFKYEWFGKKPKHLYRGNQGFFYIPPKLDGVLIKKGTIDNMDKGVCLYAIENNLCSAYALTPKKTRRPETEVDYLRYLIRLLPKSFSDSHFNIYSDQARGWSREWSGDGISYLASYFKDSWIYNAAEDLKSFSFLLRAPCKETYELYRDVAPFSSRDDCGVATFVDLENLRELSKEEMVYQILHEKRWYSPEDPYISGWRKADDRFTAAMDLVLEEAIDGSGKDSDYFKSRVPLILDKLKKVYS